MQLIVDRSRWARGEGTYGHLYDPRTKKYCILGYLLKEIGVKSSQMRYHMSPRFFFPTVEKAPDILKPLLNENDWTTVTNINDSHRILDINREKMLVKAFKKLGIHLHFADKVAKIKIKFPQTKEDKCCQQSLSTR